MGITQNALTVLQKRYFMKDEEGQLIENLEGMFHRVAGAIAEADRTFDPQADTASTAKSFYQSMIQLDFLPNSPTLMNAGRPLGQLSACFVLPVGDSMDEIFEAVKQAALIHKSGGGTGFSFSRLRPQGSTVRTTGGVASGPVSFMRVFNMATEAVKQGGTRRGANMGILRVDHPDILQFIDCKQNNADITNFNISIGITEVFMQAAMAEKDYPLIDPRTHQPVGQLNARRVFEKIVDAAWHNGEPGIIFLDRLNRDNIVPKQGEIESTNPCGEQPLLPYESCNLGSINLYNMLRETENGYAVDFDKLAATVRLAVHFLDNVIAVNRYPLPIIEETTLSTRKIGLGVMGFADMLLRLRLPYNSEEAVALAEKVMSFINETARKKSIELGQQRGSFPLFSESIHRRLPALRNGTVTTIAPTGTLSIIAGCSSGVEPVFAYVFIRNVMDKTEMVEVNPLLKELLQKRGLYSEALMLQIAKEGSLQHISAIPEDIRRVFVCAHDISPLWHIRMQAAFQKHTDNAVSKTVNFPHEATREEVAEVYRLAFQLGCKGVTIYRDRSRENQVLNIGPAAPKAEADGPRPAAPNSVVPRPRPESVCGITEKMQIGCGSLYVTVNYDENGICEVFTSTGKAGGCPSQSEATARLISIALRSGVAIDEILVQLSGIRCPSTVRREGMSCTSCPDAIARVIKKVRGILEAETPLPSALSQPVSAAPEESRNSGSCPECGQPLEHEGGCVSCRFCGYSKCG
ncbi:MAG: vitamin B12-dependent ribonucleotide reductase [Provencibacterium sp.]|jgi:ribonucleoside-diphosphate reductase alpha chain|nr:vitamin B12-dependent ribonucleotide reductase [Provencibacterium sp.]